MAINKYTDHSMMGCRVTVPCSDWFQGRCAVEDAQPWALWDCGVQSPPLLAPLGSEQTSYDIYLCVGLKDSITLSLESTSISTSSRQEEAFSTVRAGVSMAPDSKLLAKKNLLCRGDKSRAA